MKKRTILNLLLIILFLMLTFFGMGPVLFADGTDTERMYTLFVVIALYIIIFIVFYFVNKKKKI